jgi:hypothetical protein
MTLTVLASVAAANIATRRSTSGRSATVDCNRSGGGRLATPRGGHIRQLWEIRICVDRPPLGAGAYLVGSISRAVIVANKLVYGWSTPRHPAQGGRPTCNTSRRENACDSLRRTHWRRRCASLRAGERWYGRCACRLRLLAASSTSPRCRGDPPGKRSKCHAFTA